MNNTSATADLITFPIEIRREILRLQLHDRAVIIMPANCTWED